MANGKGKLQRLSSAELVNVMLSINLESDWSPSHELDSSRRKQRILKDYSLVEGES